MLEDVPHRQVVFTIPKRLRIFFRYDRSLLGELASCAWRALRLYFDVCFDGAEVTPGAVRVEDRLAAARLGRYMIRCPLALKRLSWNEDTAEVSYTVRPTRRSGPRPATVSWDVLEFIARVVDHLPDPSQQMTGYWGFYANAARGKRRKVEEEEPTTARAIRRSLELPAQEPEPLAHGPPHEIELLDQIA